MKYLSIDIEATGLNEDCLIIEFGMVPFDTEKMTVEETLSLGFYVKCPSFEELRPKLDTWVIDHNKELINKAHETGVTLTEFKNKLESYLQSSAVRSYFNLDKTSNKGRPEKIVLFGKSMNAIDLPFLSRDLGWNFMRQQFHHRVLDLSSVTLGLIDIGILGKGMDSGSELMKLLGMGEVAHTALEDARNTAIMYLKLLEKFAHLKHHL